ncbi:MAG: hydantoinase/oxoprolinase family protein [Pseudomonadota bacterium]
MAETAAVRLSADIGGTFTDVVLEVGDALFSTKHLTTYEAPERAIIAGMQQLCAQANVAPGDIGHVIHGTTLATNALIERKGARVALITTRGFRDVIEMRTESRFEQYDLNLRLPEPLLSRQHRYTLNERIGAQGQVLQPLDHDELDALAKQLVQAGYDSVAVGFMHAYANDTHERAVAAALAVHAPALSVSLSSAVSPQMREYERFNTVVANAYIKPLMKSYLQRLERQLQQTGVSCPVFLMHSGGGIISLDSAAEFPVRLVESGPAGGAVFAATIAARYQLQQVLSFDMGGTTAKICLIRDQQPKTSRVFEVARTYRFKKGSGMPISIPVIDMVEIGAGGGSVASIDALQQIRVGPESAGSEPGPACYARGGQCATVTDADLLLGKLDPDAFAGGAIALDRERAESAVLQDVGTALTMDASSAAFGVVEVVDENMANAARVHAVENGQDLADYTMIAFGGAAPLHAGRLCAKLGMRRLLIPPGAGVGSAIGFLRAPFSFEATRSVFMPLSLFDAHVARDVFASLRREADSFVRACNVTDDIVSAHTVHMRYAGQGWEIPVSLSAEDVATSCATHIRARFESAYRTLFGRTVDGADIEITVWAVNAATPSPRPQVVAALDDGESVDVSERRALFDPLQRAFSNAGVVSRTALQVGQQVTGPALIVEDETTTIVPADMVAICQPDGCLDVRYVR